MADAGVSKSDGLLGTEVVKQQYDRYLRWALRSPAVIGQFVEVHPVDPTAPGSSIVLKKYADISAVSAALTEDADVDRVVAAAPTNITVTLAEYGNAITTSSLLRLTSLADVDPAVARMIANNLIDSREGLIMTVARQGTNKTFAGASGAVDTAASAASDIASTEVVGAAQLRYSVTKLRARNAPSYNGSYPLLLHPNVAHDLRKETGQGSWRQVHEYSAPGGIFEGETGMFEGTRVIETNRVYSTTDGAASANVYRNLFFGKEALAEAVAAPWEFVEGPVVDRLKRFKHVGWKVTAGWARYREECIQALYCASSLG